ncbi:EpsG family protein [Vagococcus lutrae]|uniref:EpsG family protein n=1 Tax=Vagococcus lutrae TaxID=81947 RepID=UPI002A80A837|nr:EpsG family protein [Vagococcus lutrae]MDY3706232.1 EpsG family protein [Vagococcus lutrae]
MISNSIVMYISSVFLSSVFGGLSQKSKLSIQIRKILFIVSFLILFFVSGFRDFSIGVDGYNYLRGYSLANTMGLVQYYRSNFIEPGFYLIYRIAYIFFNDIQGVIIISSFITNLFFYLSFYKMRNRISVFWMVLFYGLTNYIFYFGIIRLGIAVSIVTFCLEHIVNDNTNKYIFGVLLASTFHFSALFMLVAVLINPNRSNNTIKRRLYYMTILIPLAFLILKMIILPIFNIERYNRYIEVTSGNNLSFLTTLPILIYIAFYYRRLKLLGKEFKLFSLLYYIKFITEIFSGILGISRMVWYLNITICFLFPAIIKAEEKYFYKYITVILLLFYAIAYFYYSNFLSIENYISLIPYKNLFFELEN